MRTRLFCTAILSFVTATAVPMAHAASDAAKATMLIARVEVLSQQLASAMNDAAGGNAEAFSSVKRTRDAIGAHIIQLDAFADGVAPKQNFAGLDAAWVQLNADATKVLESQAQMAVIMSASDDVMSKLPVLNSRNDEIVKIFAEHPGLQKEVMIASRQMLLADRMQRRIQTIQRGNEESASAASGLQRDAMFYGAMLAAMLTGNKDLDIKPVGNANAREILKDISGQWTGLAPALNKILDAAPGIEAVRQAVDKATGDVLTLLSKADALMLRINE